MKTNCKHIEAFEKAFNDEIAALKRLDDLCFEERGLIGMLASLSEAEGIAYYNRIALQRRDARNKLRLAQMRQEKAIKGHNVCVRRS